MRAYECIYILNPTLDEQAVKDKAVKYGEIVTARKGQVTSVDQWGKRRLAYPINKVFEGYYTFMRFTGMPRSSRSSAGCSGSTKRWSAISSSSRSARSRLKRRNQPAEGK